jgi:hypothetical protein
MIKGMRFALFILLPLSPLLLTAQTYAPNTLYTAGAGAITKGHGGTFAYWSLSKYIGQNSYATVISEYTMSKGAVLTCPLAGVSHIAWQGGPVSLGLTGAGGACSGDSNGSQGAASAQGFADFHIKGAWNIIATARKTFTANGDSAVKLSLGIGYGK